MTDSGLAGRLRLGIAFDLRSDFVAAPVAGAPGGAAGRADPDDLLEEFDSDATIDAIAAALESHGHAPSRLGGGRAFVERLLTAPPDLVFNIAEGRGTRSRKSSERRFPASSLDFSGSLPLSGMACLFLTSFASIWSSAFF